MKKLLITGVPGWLTNAFLESLIANPPTGLEEVNCLMLQAAELPACSTFQINRFVGDLNDRTIIDAAVEGCDAILHAAGILHVKRTADWYRINTAGTATLLEAAHAAGVQRFVLVSSNAAAGKSPGHGQLMRESDPPRPLSHYGRSKLQAEQLVLAAPLEGVVVRPCMFYGPPVPARHVDIYKRIVDGKMPLVGHGNYARSVTHIDNLVQGCMLALTKAAAIGQTYYIADQEVYTTKRIVEAMANALETHPRYLRLPALIAPLAYWGDRTLAALGLYWQNLHLVGEADWDVGVSIEKAQAELDYQPTQELAEGMCGAIHWCREKGLLPPS